jgi:Flp pilus assembly protein protease CpaA
MYNARMSVYFLLPIFSGILIATVVNYLADFLPSEKRLGQPFCLNPACRKSITWTGYLKMQRCNYCSSPRGKRAYAVLLFIIISAIYLCFEHPMRSGFLFSLIVLAYLITIGIIDLEYHLVMRPLSITGLVLAAFAGCIQNGWFVTVLGGFTGFVVMYLFYLFGKILNHLRVRLLAQATNGKEVLASGDVTLLTILGLLMGWPHIWYGLLLGILFAGFVSLLIILALIIKREYRQQFLTLFIPFGPAYILSTILLVYLPNLFGRLLIA